MSEQGVSEKLVELAAEKVYMAGPERHRVWAAIPELHKESFRDYARRFLNAALPELEAEWRERLLKGWPIQQATEAIEDLHDRPGIESATAEESAVAAINAVLAATQPHSGQPGDQG